MSGRFIVVEGIEGSGKTTQVGMLAKRLGGAGIPHLVTREPGGTAVGEEIRRVLLESQQMPARTELLLMLAARAALVAERIEPALGRGETVLADRFELSTFAYQIWGRGLPDAEVRALNRFATGGLRPDLTLVLSVDLASSHRRRTEGGRRADRIERAGAEFHTRVAEAYAALAEVEPNVVVVAGGVAPESVHAGIVEILVQRYPETFRNLVG